MAEEGHPHDFTERLTPGLHSDTWARAQVPVRPPAFAVDDQLEMRDGLVDLQ